MLRVATPEEAEADTYFTTDAYAETYDIYQEAVGCLDAAFDGLTTPITTKYAGDCTHVPGKEENDIPLARIEVPTFSGKLNEWEKFRALFQSVIGDRNSLTDAQKLYYLKSCVTGDAALILDRIPYSDANFDAAWKLLADEYDNVRKLVHAHLQAFVEFPPMKSETAADLKRLRDTVSSSCALLEALKRPINNTICSCI